MVDAAIPEEAEATAHDLAAALAADTAHFSRVSQPDASPYLERNAFLFLDVDQLTDVLDRTIDAQPFLGQLAADPSLRGLAGALSLIAEGVAAKAANLAPFLPALRSFHAALAAAADGRPTPLSWERLLAGPVADLAGKFHFVLAKPIEDFGALEPGEAASEALRGVASRLEFVRDGSARVRLTGSVALDDEEFATVAQGALAGVAGSMVLVALWLFLAVRTWRVVVPILVTLLFGLLLTAAFAALAVGTLNLVSVAFAILFIGIAVDFAIQFSVRMREAQLDADLPAALALTGRRAGGQILVAALATAAGFLAFTPTRFRRGGAARPDRGHWHADRLRRHGDGPAGIAGGVPPARRCCGGRTAVGAAARSDRRTAALADPGRLRRVGPAGARAVAAARVRQRSPAHQEPPHRGDGSARRPDRRPGRQPLHDGVAGAGYGRLRRSSPAGWPGCRTSMG